MTQWGLDVLFNPSKRHMDEEKLRQQSTREEAGDSSGGRRIDLESGRVVIQHPASGDEQAVAEPAQSAADSREEAGDVASDETGDELSAELTAELTAESSDESSEADDQRAGDTDGDRAG